MSAHCLAPRWPKSAYHRCAMMRMLLLACTLLMGACVGKPAHDYPLDVARTCTPPNGMRVGAQVEGSPTRYTETMDATCVGETESIRAESRISVGDTGSSARGHVRQAKQGSVVEVEQRSHNNARGSSWSYEEKLETPMLSWRFGLEAETRRGSGRVRLQTRTRDWGKTTITCGRRGCDVRSRR